MECGDRMEIVTRAASEAMPAMIRSPMLFVTGAAPEATWSSWASFARMLLSPMLVLQRAVDVVGDVRAPARGQTDELAPVAPAFPDDLHRLPREGRHVTQALRGQGEQHAVVRTRVNVPDQHPDVAFLGTRHHVDRGDAATRQRPRGKFLTRRRGHASYSS